RFESKAEPMNRWFDVYAFRLGTGCRVAIVFNNITERKRIEALSNEQKQLLELIASGRPLDQCLRALTGVVSRLSPKVRACVLLTDEARARFERVYSEDVPPSFGQGIHGAPINELAIGTCGTAVHSGKPVACADIANDECWSKTWRDLCVAHGILACHSTPVLRADGEAIASFFLCFGEARIPDEWELRLAGLGAHIASIAIERDRAAQAFRETLMEADRRKDEFLAMLAHELRNPLGPIRNAMQILNLPDMAEPVRSQAQDMVERQVGHLARLVDDLLDATRIARGKVLLRTGRTDLGALVWQTAEDYRRDIEASGLVLTVDIPSCPVWVEGDPTRLAQMLGNLLHNAQKFTERGGAVKVELITESGSPDEEKAMLSVCDTGIGIDPTMLRRVFDVFAQADNSLDRSRGGLGLGLALVRGLAELHGGDVEAESAGERKGAKFRIRLPLAPPAIAAEVISREAVRSPARRVLIIEDNADAAESLRLLLKFTGHTVEVANTGMAGVETARVFRPQVILCDVGLPGMSGYEVARALRHDATLAGTHLIALTGYSRDEDRRAAMEAGFDRHMVKPVDLQELQTYLAFTPGDSASHSPSPSSD
ncbi:MAG: ATP-binding protein, partial [Nitrosospira sp.]|nr:ATP-binding protein [Nitrosospira sp.]